MMLIIVLSCGAAAGGAAAGGGCGASDAALLHARKMLCNSLVQGRTPWCRDDWQNVSASKDWPSQAVYLVDVLEALLAAPAGCLRTPYARDTVGFVNGSQADPGVSGTFMWTWLDFQVQYYDMPRKPGDRIESPDTLGRKCWAFAYLRQLLPALWQPLADRLAPAGLNLRNFTAVSNRAIPETFALCEKVMANCFLNTTYNPAKHNGTCKTKIFEFHRLGFLRENIKRKNIVKYPFSPSASTESVASASSAWTCSATGGSKPSAFCSGVPVPRNACTDDGVFSDNQRDEKHYTKQLKQCQTLKKRRSVCPNEPDLCHRDVLNKTTFCGGHDQSCATSSTCLPYCYTDCYPCNTKDNCDMLQSFGIAAAPGQPCFSLEENGQSGRVLSHERVLRLLGLQRQTQ